jgi:hypothetical protein
MTSIQERKKAIEAILKQRLLQIKELDKEKNKLITEVVQIQGKLELLNELEHESSVKSTEENKT